ncbi:MAG: cytidine deaminase [Candidatus Roizmanbacteria bacterium]|nr:MAG: cytidine deaminase [Candidatus Roizmanbacteria bacterium]
MVTDLELKYLIEKAKLARENAFVPRSSHKVGACILTEDGEYFEGCNVESIISGLGTCAERAAIDHAVIHGKYNFKALVSFDAKINFPCGACLQYLLEFYQVSEKEITIISADMEGNIKTNSLFELQPHGYLTENNLDSLKSYKDKM